MSHGSGVAVPVRHQYDTTPFRIERHPVSHASPVPDHDVIDPQVHARRWFTLATLCLSLLIIVMDNTILNVAIPSLIRGLGASNREIQWVIDSYTLVFAGLLLTTGSLSDRFGRKGALQLGIVLFGLGSAASALTSTPTQLIFTRAFMGLGAALIMPSTLSILTNVFRDPKERAKAISIWSAASGIGIVVGPVLGGYLLERFSWSSVFWVNVPLAALMFLGTWLIVPESKADDAPRTDWPGVALSIAGVVGVLWGIIEAPERGWSDPLILGAFAVGILALVAFARWELHSAEPMLDVRFFRNARFSAANGAVTLAVFGMFGSLFLVSQFLQFVQGHSALQSGLRITPFAIGLALGAPIGNLLDRRIGTKLTVAGGLVVTAIGLYSFNSTQVDSPFLNLFGSMILMAIGMGTVFGPATESVMGSLPPERAGVGSAINDTTRELGGALGVAVIGSAMSSAYSSSLSHAIGSAPMPDAMRSAVERSLAGALAVADRIGGDGGHALADVAKTAYVDGMHRGVTIGSVAVLLGAVAALVFLPARAKDQATVTRDASPMSDTDRDDLDPRDLAVV